MKSFIVLPLVFSFAVTQGFSADNTVQSSPAKPAAAPARKASVATPRPGAGVRNPATVPSTRRSVPATNVRRNYANAGIPFQRGSLAMNTVRPSRNYQPRQSTDLPLNGQQINATANRPANRGTENAQRSNHNRNSYADALRRCRYDHHNSNWWKRNCRTIVFVNTGYYYLDSGYWYPAYGYDPVYNYYDYDGPIYTYGNLLPDQVIANVQLVLRDAGYYVGPITGSLGPATRAALANFQRDYGLVITGAIDEPTVQSLGLV